MLTPTLKQNIMGYIACLSCLEVLYIYYAPPLGRGHSAVLDARLITSLCRAEA